MDPTYDDLKRELLERPGTSYWLKDALRALDERDPVDALHDAETLLHLEKLRAELTAADNLGGPDA